MSALIRLAAALLLLVGPPAQAGASQGRSWPVVAVATQNQYFGADLAPLATAPPGAANAAFLEVLQSIAASDFRARAWRQARAIARQRPVLVGLQEVLALGCVNSTPPPPPGGGCEDPLIAGALVDFLPVTLAAFAAAGAPYRAVAVVENLDTRGVVLTLANGTEVALPGLPLVVDGYQVFITAVDRDVILAPKALSHLVQPVVFPAAVCRRSRDGCNYAVVAPVQLGVPGGTIDFAFERGFVGVDVTLSGYRYRFVDTHLEIPEPAPGNPASRFIQAAQAAQLIEVLQATTPAGRRLILVGDINSSPDDVPIPGPLPLPPPFDQGIVPPYRQLVAAGLTDAWTRRDPGFTCCQAADLANRVSQLDERIDVVFTSDVPERAQARLFGNRSSDKTRSGLWPSDHAGLAARLLFRPGPTMVASQP